MVDWKTDILHYVTDDCLTCIRKTEKLHSNAKPQGCNNHSDWGHLTRNERYTCGEYEISIGYYEQCGEPGGKGEANFKSCALNRSCADQCVRNYLKTFIDADCGRGSAEMRKCVDHGITHGQRQNACNARSDPYVQSYASYMVEACPGLDPMLIPGKGMKPGVVAAIVVPIVILLSVVLAVMFWWWKRRRYRDPGPDQQGRVTNTYILKGISDLPIEFDYDNCSPAIKEMLANRQIAKQDLDLKEEIGRGQFGVIRKAELHMSKLRSKHITVAVKMIRSKTVTEQDIDGILHEAFIMSNFCHINVLSIIGIVWKPGAPPLVVLPYMGKGSLLEMVRNPDNHFTGNEMLNFMEQISAGLEYLESLRFVHRDIALRNCLVSDYFVVKIGDFGLSRDVYDTGIYDCEAQTDKKFDIREKRLPWKWLAPECMSEGLFTHKSDVWAFGILIWELHNSGRTPYPAIDDLTALQESLKNGYRLAKPDSLQDEIYDLMKQMWVDEWKDRPSFQDIHQILQKLSEDVAAGELYNYTTEVPDKGREKPLQKTVSSNSKTSENEYVDSTV